MADTRCDYFAQGTRIIFCAYLDEDMPASQQIFRVGDFGVVASVNEDGGLQCFPTDESGKVITLEGDTLFPEEVQALTFAPKLDVNLVLHPEP